MKDTVVELVRAANPDRQGANLNRRCHKLFEELGELEEAWLQVTSKNHKQMTLADCREEAADVLIVALDIGLTPFGFGLRALFVGHSDPEFWSPYKTRDYDEIVGGIAESTARLLPTAHLSSATGGSLANDVTIMVKYAFSLVCLIFEGDEAAIIAEVTRKLDKWAAQRASGSVATDAE